MRRRWIWIAAGAVIVIGVVVATLVLTRPSVAPESLATASPTQTPIPPAEVPRVATARGVLDGWTAAPATQLAAVGPQVGDAGEGSVSAVIDAPVVDGEVVALAVTVPVDPDTQYSLSTLLRVLTEDAVDVPVRLEIGSETVPLPQLNARWASVARDYETGADEHELAIQVIVTGAVCGLGVDSVSLVAVGDDAELIPNGSFEAVQAAAPLANDALILDGDGAVLAVALPSGDAAWRVVDRSGTQVIGGTHRVESSLDAIDLEGLPQGLYTVELTDAGGGSHTSPLGIVDFAAGRATSDPRFGVGIHVENAPYADAARAVAATGFAEARNDILWHNNEVESGRFDFADAYTTEFAKLHVNGISLLGIVNYGNPLYDGGGVPVSADAVAAYGRYAAAVAQQFDVSGLEIYNEFNHERFNTSACGVAPECYVPLLQAAQDAVHAVKPDVPIVAGSTALYDAPWFQGLWTAGGLQFADVVSFHPYEVAPQPDAIAGVVAAANADLQAYAGGTKPIWITELGWTTNNNWVGISPELQASYLVRAEATALAAGVEKYFWYDLLNDSDDPAEHEGNFGLFARSTVNIAAPQPKPAAMAQALLIEHLGGRAFATTEQVGDGVTSILFGDASDAARVAWAPGGAGTAAYASDVALEVTDVFGSRSVREPVDGVVSIDLTADPVFIGAVAAG